MQLLAAVCPGLLLVDEVDAERAERAELEPNLNRTEQLVLHLGFGAREGEGNAEKKRAAPPREAEWLLL